MKFNYVKMKTNSRIIALVLAFVVMFSTTLRVNADFEIHWKDEVTTRVTWGNEYDAKLSDTHPFHYYLTYDWDYVKKGTAALREVQKKAGVTPSGESNYVYYMAMLRAMELGIDASHAHLSPSHGNIFEFSRMPYGENYTSSSKYEESVANWVNSEGHYQAMINNHNRSMAFGCSNGGSISVFSSLSASDPLGSAKKKNIVKGMPLYVNPFNNYGWYRIQFDESDFTSMTLSGIAHYEGVYYQAAKDDIGHVTGAGWSAYFTGSSEQYSFGNFTCQIGDTYTFIDKKLYPTFMPEAKTYNELLSEMGKLHNNCYVCLSLDDFIVSSSNPSVVSVDSNNVLTVNGSGEYMLTFTYKYNTAYSFTYGSHEVKATGSTPDQATTKKPVKPGLNVDTSEGEYEVNKDKTLTYVEPVNTAKNKQVITIPDTVKINNKSYKVTRVAPKAYANNPNIQSVVCGKYVTTIGKEAFKGCTNLTSVVAPGVKTIDKGAFYGCTNLQSVTGKNITTIEQKAFAQCTSLSSLYFGKVKYIKKEALKGCALRSVSLSKVVSVGDGAFSYNTSLTSATFGKYLKSLGKKVFYKDNAMKKITIKSTKYKPSASTYSGLPKKTPVTVPKSVGKMYKKTWKKTRVKLKY